MGVQSGEWYVGKPLEHPGYAPLDEPEGLGVEMPDTYLYEVQGCHGVVLCSPCARWLRTADKQVVVLEGSSNRVCKRCHDGQHLGRVNEQ